MNIGRKALMVLSVGSFLSVSSLTVRANANDKHPTAGTIVEDIIVMEKFPTEVESGSVKLKDDSKQKIVSLAEITSIEAATIAKKALPGTVVKTKLDDENGYLIWEVEIIDSKNQETKLMIDAGNGRLLAAEKDEEEHSSWKFWEDNDKDEHEDRD